MVKAKAPAVIGKVSHYFDQAMVAVIAVTKGSLKVGDEVTFQKGDHQVRQTIESMQIDHQPVNAIKKGDEAGVKVNEPIKEGYEVVKG